MVDDDRLVDTGRRTGSVDDSHVEQSDDRVVEADEWISLSVEKPDRAKQKNSTHILLELKTDLEAGEQGGEGEHQRGKDESFDYAG